jgi:DNA-directed RNA polymerase specialized sigma24 family protein
MTQTAQRRRSKKSLYANERHKILREVYRHYTDFRDAVARGDVNDVIDYAVETEEGSGQYIPMNISFSDLKHGLGELAPRKREAFFYNVILDWKQKDVAEKMGITTVSVGQYVDAAMIQLSKRYFAEVDDNVLSGTVTTNSPTTDDKG